MTTASTRRSFVLGTLGAVPALVAQTPARPKLYHEALRPQFHFTARYWNDYRLNPKEHQEGWINDVNGLVYLDGEYHLFAQRWWSCWLHAVSKDLVHWEELPPAFGKDEKFGGTQSGGAVVDYANTSGLATGKTPVMIAFWASVDNKRQCISYSNDKGRTWTKYAGNPVLVHPERDPKVFWYEPDHKWIMVLYGPPEHSYLLFESKNLLAWKPIGAPIPDMYECPDMFPLKVDGDPAKQKWVIIDGSGAYVTGRFDGTNFQAETKKQPGDYGRNFYATMTWVGIPQRDGRRIQIAWMRGGAYPDMPFNQQLTFPAELTLRSTPDGPRLFRTPIREIASLYAGSVKLGPQTLKPGGNPLAATGGEALDVAIEIDAAKTTADEVVFEARGNPVKYSFKDRTVDSCGVRVPLPARSGRVTLRMLVDRMSIETFGNDGAVSITNVAAPQPAETPLALRAVGGSVALAAMRVSRIGSIWP